MEWKKFTETGQPKVDESTLAELHGVPEAELVLEYLTLSKRLGMVKSWLDNVDEANRIHGRVNTIGAVTHRMSHSKPNLAQIPSGEEYRSCFIVPSGHKLVGVDAAGLELRMLAHYMNDPDYTKKVVFGKSSEGTDVHTANMKAAGLPDRDAAKTFIYAFLYGAGDEKIGNIVGGGEAAGRKLKAEFLAATPLLRALISKCKKLCNSQGWLPGLDGRRVYIRHEHAALNTLLQSAGAIVMKQALVIAAQKLQRSGLPYKLVAQVHDEFQVEVPEEYAERVAVSFRNAIRQAGRDLDLNCPLDGDYKIGDSWAETH